MHRHGADAGPVPGETVARSDGGVGLVGRIEHQRQRAQGGEPLLECAVHVGVTSDEVSQKRRAQELSAIVLVEHRPQGPHVNGRERLASLRGCRGHTRCGGVLALDCPEEAAKDVAGAAGEGVEEGHVSSAA